MNKTTKEALKARQSFNGTWYVDGAQTRRVVKTGLTEVEAKRLAGEI